MSSIEIDRSSLQRVFEAAGSQAELARRLRISQQSVNRWARKGRVPLDRLPQIERAVGGAVTRVDLAPDLFEGLRVA